MSPDHREDAHRAGFSSDTGRTWELTGPDDNALVGEISGPADGPAVIMLHGGGQSRSSWRFAAERLANAGYNTLAFDLRGHGDSAWSADGDYGIERFVADLLATIKAVGAPAILVGASFGGHVALVTAARYPALVRALILCDVTPWIEGQATKAIRAIMCTAAAGFETVEDAARQVDMVRGVPSDHNGDRLAKSLRRGPDGRLYWRWDPMFFSHHQEFSEYLTDTLHAAATGLTVPTLLVRASCSEIVTPDQVYRFRRLVPHAVVTEIEGARHTVSSRDNDAYASIVLEFLHNQGSGFESGPC